MKERKYYRHILWAIWAIARMLKTNRPKLERHIIAKALELWAGLNDLPRNGKPKTITPGNVRPSRSPRLTFTTLLSFSNFDLKIEWKISNGGNSGIFYLAREVPGKEIWTYL